MIGVSSPKQKHITQAQDDPSARNSLTGKAVEIQQLADLHLDDFEEFFVVHLVNYGSNGKSACKNLRLYFRITFVEKHDQGGNAHLLGQQQMLSSLRHGAIRSRHHKDGAVHLSSSSDHVLHVIRVA